MVGYNYFPEPTGIGKYSGEMIAWLAQHGYECEVVTSYPYYPFWKIQGSYLKKQYWYHTEYHETPGGKVKVHRCPMYVPAAPTGLKRVFLDLSFLIAAFFKVTQLLFDRKFDYVLTVAPCFQFGLIGVFYKKLRKAVLLYHVQDLQIEAARDLNMIKSKAIIDTMFRLEKYIFKHADKISSISEGMVRKIRLKGKKDVYLFANWTDCKSFYPISDNALLKEAHGFKPSDKIVLYSGAIGEKQGLEAILYAAKSLEKNHDLKFLICGSGPYKQKLSLLCEQLGLQNVLFYPLQPYEKFNDFLNLADVHLVIQKANASDLVMPSKLTTVLGVGGLAIITANAGTCLHSLVDQHKLGLLIEPENQKALIEAIQKAVTENHGYLKLNARRYTEEHLSIDKVMEAYEKEVLKSGLHTQNQPLLDLERNAPQLAV